MSSRRARCSLSPTICGRRKRDWDVGLNGCSFATPHVAGLMAQQIDAGNRLGLSTDPLVVKATIMNSASKIPDKQNNPWEPASSSRICRHALQHESAARSAFRRRHGRRTDAFDAVPRR